MNYFEKQMRILFGESELFSEAMCSGKMMIGKNDQDVRVKLEFISTNIAKQYNAMKVTVLNRTEGEIDKTVFPFRDILGPKNGYDPYIWDEPNCMGWYGFKPTGDEYDRISDTINDYMSMFADENLGYEMRSM